MAQMTDVTKIELAKALKAVKKAAGHWEKCLLVQLEGIGRFDETATQQARQAYSDAQGDVLLLLSGGSTNGGLLEE